jgi:hypothetical protein
VCDAQVSINGVNKINGGGYSTLFLEGWSDEKIVREFSEGLKSGSTVLGPFGRETVTPSGVTIKYFVMKGRIDTFYPVFRGADRRGE